MSQELLRVLLVDDETSFREPLAKHLHQTRRYQVDTAATAQEFLRRLEQAQGRYDVALIDDLLIPESGQEPEPLGIQLTRAIKSRYPNIEVIIFTGWGLQSGLEALQAGAYRYLAKPFNLEELGMLIRTAAEHRRLKGVAREKQILEQLMETSAALLSGRSLSDVLAIILQGVQAIGFDRVRLYLLSEDGQFIVGQAHVGMEEAFVGLKLPLAGDSYRRSLLAETRPRVFKRQADKPLLYEQRIAGETVDQWFYAPLLLRGQVIGVLSADNKVSRRPIVETDLGAVALFASQAAAAIENANLIAKEREAMQQAERRACTLAAIQEVSTKISSLSELNQILEETCRAVVELFGADHSGLVLFEPDYDRGQVVAEYPALGTRGLEIPVRGVTAEETLIVTKEPLVISDIASYSASLGPVYDIFDQFDICSILIVPLIFEERVLGSFSLDKIGDRQDFSQEEIDLCQIFAAQLATAVENARLFRETNRRGELLAALDESSRHIRAEKGVKKLLQEMVRLAADLVDCQAGGLYINRPQLKELELRVIYGLPDDLIGDWLSFGEGLIGSVARTGRPKIIHPYDRWPAAETTLQPFAFKTVIGVPLRQAGEVEAVLFIADKVGSRQFTETDLDILERFTVQASLALQTSRLINREQGVFVQLALLHRISDYIQTAEDLDKILHVVLTGVTAGYGLGFNRAALLFVTEQGQYLVGRLGIGHLDKSKARAAWASDRALGLDDVGRYLDLLEQETLPPTPVDEAIQGLRLPIAPTGEDIFSQVVVKGRHTLVRPQELQMLPDRFVKAFEPALPCIVVPLTARDQVIGLIVADNKFTQSPITSQDIESLLTFTNTAAVAIDNTRLFQETRAAQERLSSFFVASNALVSSDDKQVLQDIVEQARAAADAGGVGLYLIDETGQVQSLMVVGMDEASTLADIKFRPEGLSMQVMRTGQPVVIEDVAAQRERVNQSMIQRGIGAALCLPVSLEGERIGVMWVHYSQPRHFSRPEVEALQLYVNQAAIAYDSARRIRELVYMRRAAESLARVAELPQVLEQIVESAREVLQADSAVIWSYDAVRNQFIPEKSVIAGIAGKRWKESQKAVPRRGGTAYTAMERKWVGVTDIENAQQYSFLGGSTRDFLQQIGARSFQGIALIVEGEKLGVLYVNYNRPRSFSEIEQKTARTFANHAALALKKAKLLEQLSKARNTAKVVAEVTTLEDIEATLHSVAEGTQDALGCDAVTLYGYDQSQDKLTASPVMVGVRYPDRAARVSDFSRNHNIVFEILKRDAFYIAEDVTADLLFKERRFPRDEQIATCVAIPLRVGPEKVGVMFVNYRTRHRFTEDELANIELFAHQAAVAIRHAQLYEQVQRRAGALQALYEASQAITGTLELEEILNCIVEQAPRVTRHQQQQISLACLRLVEGQRSWVAAAYPPEQWLQAKEISGGEIELDAGRNGRIGIMGRAAITGEPQAVGNVAADPDYLKCHPRTRSELAVPIKVEGEVIGVINVEHAADSAFDEEDKHALQSLAAQAGAAIRKARLFEEVQRRARLLDAAAQVARGTTSILDEDQLLAEVVQLVVDCFDFFYHAGIFLMDDRREYALLRAVSSEAGGQRLLERGHKLKVGREGIVGLVAQNGRPRLTSDVAKDHHHYLNPDLPDTRAEMAFPLIARGRVIGVLDVQSKEVVDLQNEDVATLQTMADQLANAIHNAQLYQKATRRLDEINALQQVAVSLAGASELREVLNLVVTEAMKLTDTDDGRILFWDSRTETFTQMLKTDAAGVLQPYTSRARTQGGLTRTIIDERKPCTIFDTQQDPRTASTLAVAGHRATLGVPLLNRTDVMGVLYVHGHQPRHFSKRQITLLEALASQAAVAIDRAGRYEELKRTKGLVGARTAVAWMGMVSATWRHAIEGHAMTIREEIQHLRADFPRVYLAGVEKRLAKIERLADLVLEKPITPPLSEEEGVESVPVNELLRERLRQLWENEPYKLVQLQAEFCPDESAMVRASPAWLRRAFDVLIDNAIEAMAAVPRPRLTVSTRQIDSRVEIVFTDTGPGIPKEVQSKLFHEQIKKPPGAKGLGMGLLMAQTIAQTYGGEIKIGAPPTTGARMIVTLPIESQAGEGVKNVSNTVSGFVG